MTNHPHSNGQAVHNHILASLLPGDFDRLKAHLEPVELALHEDLLEPGKPAEFVHFLESGMVSLIIALKDGATTEVGLVGNEGLVGIAVPLGGGQSTFEAVVQIPGYALRMRAAGFRDEMETNASLRNAVLNFMQARLIQVSQLVACNSHHSLRQRLARWLLMANDCGKSHDVVLSHEYVAMMLAVQRSTVSLAVGELKDAGVVSTGHGRITIVDRKRLENEACECYEAVKHEYQRLLGPV